MTTKYLRVSIQKRAILKSVSEATKLSIKVEITRDWQ